MSSHQWRQTCASALGVAQNDPLPLWLLRLFVLPPPAGRRRSDHSPPAIRVSSVVAAEDRRILRRWIGTMALSLGVRDTLDIREWFYCLFLNPSTRWDRPGPSSREATHAGSSAPTEFVPGTETLAELREHWKRLCGWAKRLVHSVLPEHSAEKAAHWLERVGQAATETTTPARWSLLLISGFLFVLSIATPLSGEQQTWYLIGTLATALLVRRLPGDLPVIILVMLSLLATFRYSYWRITNTLLFESMADTFFGLLLLLAEAYTWLILLFGYTQTILPLRRFPTALPDDTRLWPSVDIFIPTYNEPLRVVRTTVLAALGIDWPKDKIRIHILDDGRRDSFRDFAEDVGVGYITRDDNAHAKAGNMNHALTLTQGEYIAIFDCDHIPTRSFLQVAMGWFFRDPKCALVQTPHHFFSADPFERNLGTFRRVPTESDLFHRLIQDGNDLWNAAFFCGSCAVIKRGPLQEVGGIAVETVTEDSHTALKMHRLGYSSAYINLPQAAGLATESLSSHIGQRIRWARGMVQIFRIDNPFLGKGLSFFQRLCYGNAMLHFFHGIPRLIFLIAPLTYLFFQLHIIHAQAATLALYVLPYIVHANVANSRIQGRFRHSLWASVYESVLSWYITIPTTMALINPRLGKFNVTPKGGLIEKSYFDWKISKPFLILLMLNLLGFMLGLCRLLWWNAYESDVVILNLFWTSLNLITLGTAVGVAYEERQVRESHRVPVELPATLYLSNGNSLHCSTVDYSFGGLGIKLPHDEKLPIGQLLSVALVRGDEEFSFPARVAVCAGRRVGLKFEDLSVETEARLVQCTFARADAWHDWHATLQADTPATGVREVLIHAWSGYRGVGSSLWQGVQGLAEKSGGYLVGIISRDALQRRA